MILFFLGAFGLPFFDSDDLTPRWLEDPNQAGSHRIADFSFTDQRGDRVVRADLLGQIHVADFFFTTCPGICAALTRSMKRVQDATTDIRLVSYSVTPESDTPEVLASFGKRFQIDEKRWFLLTGDKESVYRLARASYFADGQKNQGAGSEVFLHTENLFLVDTVGRIRGVYNGTRAIDVTRLLEDIVILKSEVSGVP